MLPSIADLLFHEPEAIWAGFARVTTVVSPKRKDFSPLRQPTSAHPATVLFLGSASDPTLKRAQIARPLATDNRIKK
jgi:hypothetical protein